MKHVKLFEAFVSEEIKFGTAKWDKFTNLQDELASLKQELKDAWSDMENDPEIEVEGGPVADEWGEKIEKIEDEIKKIEDKIEKMENPSPRKPRADKGDSKKILLKNIEDIKNSRKTYPDRTIEQQALIYKKRFKISDDENKIVQSIIDLENSNTLSWQRGFTISINSY